MLVGGLETQQSQSLPSNDEDSDPPPILTNDGKRQQQQDYTRDNKKQKHQENAILLTITETPLPQLIVLSDPIPTPTDPLLETLAILTPQIEPQPHITESITNETTVNYPNQEQTTTWTHGFKHHSLPMIDPSLESLLSEVAKSISSQKHNEIQKPANWNEMSASARKNWYNRRKKSSI